MTSTTPSALDTASMDLPFAKFHNALQRLRARVRTGLLIEGLAIVGIALAIYFVVTLPLDRFLRLETPVRAVLLLIFVGVVAWLVFKRSVQPMLFELDDEELALAVERTNEPLGQRLISALQFERRFKDGVFHGDSPEMMAKVVAELPSALDDVRFHEAVRREQVAKNLMFVLLSFGLLTACAWQYDGFGLWAKRNLLLSSIDWPRATMLTVVGAVDGEILVPRGDDFTIEVEAAGVVPESVRVRYRFDGGTTGTDTMTQNVGEARFNYTFPGVLDPMTIEAWGGDGETDEIRVRLVDRPRLLEETLRLEFPEYMSKDAQVLDASTTQAIVPRGTRVVISARASKALDRAELQVGESQRAPLTISGDGTRIDGSIAPTESGLLVTRLTDRDGLSEGPGRSVVLRVVPDKAPLLRTRVRGLGSMITQRARIPIELEAVDDFGLVSIRMFWGVGESAAIGSSEKLEASFQLSKTEDLDRFESGSLVFEGLVRHDLLPLVKNAENPEAPENPVRPGLFVAVRFDARDNDRSEESEGKRSRSDSFTFKVVTEAELLRELNRRQSELRLQFEKIFEGEKADRAEFVELENPKSDGELGLRVRNRLAKLARRQRSLAKRVLETGRRYGEILDEMINNRVADGIGGEGRVRALRSAIVDRLETLGKSTMPTLAGTIVRYQRSGTDEDQKPAIQGYDEVVRAMQRILREMLKLESFTEVLTQLKDLIRIENKTAEVTRKKLEAELKGIFGGRDEKDDDKDR